MKEEEIESPSKKFTTPLMETLPLTIMGILIVVLFSAGRLNESGQDTLVDVLRTGFHLLFLYAFYFVGYTIWYFTNKLLSRATSEKEANP